MTKLIDTHCHLNFPDFKDDLDAVLNRAREHVEKFITINTKLSEAKDLQRIADQHKDVYCAVGLHPCSAAELGNIETLYDDIIELSSHKKVVAIGETGLDYFYTKDTKDTQIESFKTHISAANHLKLPIVIHGRDADADILDCIKDSQYKGVLHCFTGSYETAMKAIDLGFYISFSGIATFNSAGNLRDVLKRLPIDRILVETDAPYLAPDPVRKQTRRNEPGFVYHTALQCSETLQIPYEEFAEQTTKNAMTLFNFS